MPGRRTAGLPFVVLLVAATFVRPAAWGARSPDSQTVASPETRTEARVHHLHVLVDDPIAAMQTRATKFGGTVVPLRGLGAGVRVGNHYLLFDRSQNSSVLPAGSDRMRSVFDASVRWLSEHGISVEAAEFARLPATMVSEALPLDHVGFVSASFANAVEEIVARGAHPLSRTSEAAMFGLPGGDRVEILKNTEAPDAYWCPMHPGVRSGAGGRCPLCSMDLVGDQAAAHRRVPDGRRRDAGSAGSRPRRRASRAQRPGKRQAGVRSSDRAREAVAPLHRQPRSRVLRTRASGSHPQRQVRSEARGSAGRVT